MSKEATEAGYFHEGMLLKEQPADYYRTTADRYRKLLAETMDAAVLRQPSADLQRGQSITWAGLSYTPHPARAELGSGRRGASSTRYYTPPAKIGANRHLISVESGR